MTPPLWAATLVGVLVCEACVSRAGRPSMPGALEQVRVDTAARALARAEDGFEAKCPQPSCDRTHSPYRELAAALARAVRALEDAQFAADRAERGDGRAYADLKATFAFELREVSEALREAKVYVPPGLCGVIAASPDTRCREVVPIE